MKFWKIQFLPRKCRMHERTEAIKMDITSFYTQFECSVQNLLYYLNKDVIDWMCRMALKNALSSCLCSEPSSVSTFVVLFIGQISSTSYCVFLLVKEDGKKTSNILKLCFDRFYSNLILDNSVHFKLKNMFLLFRSSTC